jgi:hypothetical protein
MKILLIVLLISTSCFALPVVRNLSGPPVPPFLEDAPKKVIASFHDLISNAHDLNDKQIDQAVEEWIEKQSDDIQVYFEIIHSILWQKIEKVRI